MSIIFAAIGYAILSVVSILDKFLISSAKVKPALYAFYSSVFLLPTILLLFFTGTNLSGFFDWFLAAACGFTFIAALWCFFVGLDRSEVSHIGPLVGAIVPMFTVIFSTIFLNEVLSEKQFIAGGFLVLGSCVILFEKSKHNRGPHHGAIFGILAGLLFAASYVINKYLYDVYGFATGFIWSRFFTGLFSLPLLFHPDVYYRLVHPSLSYKVKQKFSGWFSSKNNFALIFWDKFLSIVGIVLIQYATAIGSVSLVNALNGLQYAILVLLVMGLSFFWPKIFKEHYTPIIVFEEFLSTVLILTGLYLLV